MRAGAVILSLVLMAHHGTGGTYDMEKPITLKGTVIKMEWINPHSWIHINVKNADGTTTEWMIESGTPKTFTYSGRKSPWSPLS